MMMNSKRIKHQFSTIINLKEVQIMPNPSFKERRENLRRQIRELNDSNKSPKEKELEMITLDALMEELDKEEMAYLVCRNQEI